MAVKYQLEDMSHYLTIGLGIVRNLRCWWQVAFECKVIRLTQIINGWRKREKERKIERKKERMKERKRMTDEKKD